MFATQDLSAFTRRKLNQSEIQTSSNLFNSFFNSPRNYEIPFL